MKYSGIWDKIPNKAVEICSRINIYGGEAYVVGGALRDIFSGRSPKDIDIATNLNPQTVLELFKESKFVGESFGVVLVEGYEVATFRHDHCEGDGKSATVTFTESIEEDLFRRDFTVNAMALHPNGYIIDPTGGLNDLNKKLVRFVGDPQSRINEDYCRILRAFRFVAKTGGMLEHKSKEAIRESAFFVDKVAKERVRMELLSLLSVPDIVNALELMYSTGVLDYVLPLLAECHDFEQNHHHKYDLFTHQVVAAQAVTHRKPLLRLAMLIHDLGKLCTKELGDDMAWHFISHEDYSESLSRDVLKDLTFPSDEINYVAEIVGKHMFKFDECKPARARRFITELKHVHLNDMFRVRIADRAGNPNKVGISANKVWEYRKKFKAIKPVHLNKMPIDGNMVMQRFNLTPGPEVGKILVKAQEILMHYPDLTATQLMSMLACEA